jgi:proteasome lid subunit RPN8/RPN11
VLSPRKDYALSLTKSGLGYILGHFSQTHPVTMLVFLIFATSREEKTKIFHEKVMSKNPTKHFFHMKEVLSKNPTKHFSRERSGAEKRDQT